MLSYEEAIMARQNLIKENKIKVDEIKEEVSLSSFFFVIIFWKIFDAARRFLCAF